MASLSNHEPHAGLNLSHTPRTPRAARIGPSNPIKLDRSWQMGGLFTQKYDILEETGWRCAMRGPRKGAV